MQYLGLAAAFVVLAWLTKSKKGFAITFGILAIVSFITWLKQGAGFDFLDWTDNPTVPAPDIDVPGVR